MELSKIVSDMEMQVEEKFERLEVVQTEFDDITIEYEEKLAELE